MRAPVIRVGLALVAAASLLAGGASSAAASDPQYPGGPFSDDDGSVHEASINALAAAGVTAGCGAGEGLYCPADPVLRAQMASFLVRALGLPEAGEDFFSDDDGSVHEASINALAAAGVTAGCGAGEGLYCPADPVLRAQMASFLVRALGLPEAGEDFFSDDDGSVHEASINALAAAGVTAGCGAGEGLYCPADPVLRAQMASFLVRALDLEPIEPAAVPWGLDLVVDRVVGGTTDLQAPAGDDRLFLVLKDGYIRIIADGGFLPEPFLDLSDSVFHENSEQGLLGLAFHPGYHFNGRFFVFYTDLDGHSQVYEYRRHAEDPDRAGPGSARPVLTIEQRPTAPTHKAGQLQFGPDGYLYIAVGDGGGSGDPFGHGQNPHTLLGTILRIDVDGVEPYGIPVDNPFADGVDGLPEVWAYGLRNPWRFSFDDSRIYIADVGHVDWEEVNVADAAVGGINYGWNRMEGATCYRGSNCNQSGLFVPQVEYTRTDGVSVIGGYAYRGTAIPEMVGHYFYADFVGRWIRTFSFDGEVREHYDWSREVERPRFVWSFGVDGHNELYVLGRWSVWKVVPAAHLDDPGDSGVPAGDAAG